MSIKWGGGHVDHRDNKCVFEGIVGARAPVVVNDEAVWDFFLFPGIYLFFTGLGDLFCKLIATATPTVEPSWERIQKSGITAYVKCILTLKSIFD